MTARQSGLGRGLSSLIPPKKKNSSKDTNYFGGDVENETMLKEIESEKIPAPFETVKNTVGDIALRSIMEIPVDKIFPNPFQPRKVFDQLKLQELSDSIKEHGFLQPLVVTRRENDEYELIAGERRLQAGKLAGITKIPVIVKTADDKQKLEWAIIENIQRHNLNVMEEARAYKELGDKYELTQEEIAKRVGKNRSTVANMLRLLGLPTQMQRALEEGRISEGHARTILSIVNPEKQRALFDLILRENLTVRQAEEKVREVSVASHSRRISHVDPEILNRENSLASSLGTKVKIKNSRKGGQIIIDYYSGEEFNNLFNKLTSAE